MLFRSVSQSRYGGFVGEFFVSGWFRFGYGADLRGLVLGVGGRHLVFLGLAVPLGGFVGEFFAF